MTMLEATSDLFKSVQTAVQTRPDEVTELIYYLEDNAMGGDILEFGPVAAELTECFYYLLSVAVKEVEEQVFSAKEIRALLQKTADKDELLTRKIERWKKCRK